MKTYARRKPKNVLVIAPEMAAVRYAAVRRNPSQISSQYSLTPAPFRSILNAGQVHPERRTRRKPRHFQVGGMPENPIPQKDGGRAPDLQAMTVPDARGSGASPVSRWRGQ